MSESSPIYITCASGNNVFSDCLVLRRGDLVRLIGHEDMDFTPLAARQLALTILDLIGDDHLPKSPDPESPPKRARKIGGSFGHTGTLVAEFQTTASEPRVVLEFDAPVQGMLHVYRPDPVEIIHAPPTPLDSGDDVVESVRQKFLERSLAGQQKYGHKMTREDLSLTDWLVHQQQELMDATLYAEATLRQLERLQDDLR